MTKKSKEKSKEKREKKKNIKLDDIIKNRSLVLDFKDDNLLILKSDGNIILEAEYNFYGIIKDNMFIWGTSIPLVSDKFIKEIKEVKAKVYVMEEKFKNSNKNDKDYKLNYINYNLLSQDVLLLDNIKDPVNLINNLLSELTNTIYLLNPTNSRNNVQFIGLSKITKRYF
jgi:hypothetical protein